LYGTITEFCTPTTCPVMSAGPQYEYLWADGVKVKKPIKVSAPEYVDLLMSWVETQLNDEHIFPLQLGTPFPKKFKENYVMVIFKRLFRVYAHIYHSHFQKIVGLGAEAHLNTCFKHFIYFVHEFKLIDPKELEPLKDLIDSLMGKDTAKEDDGKAGGGAAAKADDGKSAAAIAKAADAKKTDTAATAAPAGAAAASAKPATAGAGAAAAAAPSAAQVPASGAAKSTR